MDLPSLVYFRPSLARSAQCVFLALFLVALHSTWYLLYNNGTVDLMTHVRAIDPHLLPGTSAPLKEVYTGFKALDYQLTVLTLFFWETVDGSIPHASLQAFHFAGQIAAAWGLIMIESMRAGNRWRLVSFVMFWGLLIQGISFTVTMPIYFILHLSTSPTICSSKTKTSANANELHCVIYSLTLGYIIPVVLLSLPAPSVLSFEKKQSFIALWQAFPLWVGISQQIFAKLRPFFSRPQEVDDRFTFKAFRSAYTSLLRIAGYTHILTVTVMLLSMTRQMVFTSEEAGRYHPTKVMIPMAITSATKVSSIGQGALLLLQYDELFGSTAMLLWATFLYINAIKDDKNGPQYSILLSRMIVSIVLTGPIGCAVLCIWTRDEMIYKKEINEKRMRDIEFTKAEY